MTREESRGSLVGYTRLFRASQRHGGSRSYTGLGRCRAAGDGVGGFNHLDVEAGEGLADLRTIVQRHDEPALHPPRPPVALTLAIHKPFSAAAQRCGPSGFIRWKY